MWQALIAGGADIEAHDEYQRTSLVIASERGHLCVVEVWFYLYPDLFNVAL